MLALIFIFGAIIGSFLNVVLLRKNTGISFVYNDSRCFCCNAKLKWWEMVPILSFIFLGRKCSHCGCKISWQYPIVEIVVGFIAVVVGVNFYFAAFTVLFLIAAYDFKNKIIDSHFLYIFGAFAVYERLSSWILSKNFILADLSSSFLAAFLFYLLWRLSKGKWMGRGDSNLAFFLAIFLGFPGNIFMLVLAFWIGAVVGIVLLLTGKGHFNIKSEVPFGPFLAVSTFILWNFSAFFNSIYHVYFF